MTIQFQCDECGNQLQVPEEHAGKMASCPDCQALTRIPGVAQDAPTRLSPSPAPPEKQPAFSANPYQSPTVSLSNSKLGFQSVEKGPLRPYGLRKGVDRMVDLCGGVQYHLLHPSPGDTEADDRLLPP